MMIVAGLQSIPQKQLSEFEIAMTAPIDKIESSKPRLGSAKIKQVIPLDRNKVEKIMKMIDCLRAERTKVLHSLNSIRSSPDDVEMKLKIDRRISQLLSTIGPLHSSL